MPDYGHDLSFGVSLTPNADQADAVIELARLADRVELDLLGMQDHPYQPRFLDMWTLLAVVAGQTERIRLVPDVVNLPLRPPAVLARAAASLDILSNGRVELGLGSGAFARAVGSMGGPEREPGESIDALEEAMMVIRALWTPGRPVTFAGEHYTLKGAQPGPFPPHPIGLWLGAYKPRILRLTGRLADGWIPSLGYADPADLNGMNAIIDEAAQTAGRDPMAVRRAYNLSGRFSSVEQGYLNGPVALWVAQLTALALDQGISAFVIGPGEDAVSDMQRFAEEVAPAVREAVAAARAGQPRRPTAASPTIPDLETLAASESAEAPRSALLDETLRPHADEVSDAPISAAGRMGQQRLVQIHESLREELRQMRQAAVAVAEGRLDAAAARSILNQMAVRQNYWTLGGFCAQFCRYVTGHHTIEDRQLFPAIQRVDSKLSAVLVRLREEHEIIAEVVERLDDTLGVMMVEPDRLDQVRTLANELGDALLSHFAYEEHELLGPLGRSNILV